MVLDADEIMRAAEERYWLFGLDRHAPAGAVGVAIHPRSPGMDGYRHGHGARAQ